MRRLLWVDCSAGAIVGVTVLLLSEWLSALYGLPRGLLLVTGAANLLYASYSFSLARQPVRPMRWIVLLVAANAAWAVVCIVLAVVYGPAATVFGVGHLVGEGLFVGGLAALEWRHREQLRTAA